MHSFKILVETKISITDETIKTINIIKENTVCLNISILTFSFVLSLIIDLYNFIPLTANASIAGITNKFCNNNNMSTKIIPLEIPIMLMHAAIVYPKQNPLYATIPNTAGIPIIVVPKNHKPIASMIFCPILVFSNSIKFKSSVVFNFSIN